MCGINWSIGAQSYKRRGMDMAALAEVKLQKTAIKCKMVFTHFSPSYVDSPKNHFVDSDYCLSALASLSVLPNAVNRIVGIVE